MTVKPVRSPAYPSMSLKDAIYAAKKIEAIYRSSPVDRELGAKLIGYSSLSGPANKALAALASFGLVDRAGKGMMRVTSLARSILHAQHNEEYTAALSDAAMQPQLFKDIRERFPDITPPIEAVKNYLNREGFNSNAVGPAAKAFCETMAFIEEQGVTGSHGSTDANGAESNLPDDKFGGAHVGDLVQWESDGVLQFQLPRRVRWVSEDEAWVAVEGSDTGIPMTEVIVESANSSKTPPPIPAYAAPPPPSQANEGFSEWFRAKVGPDKLITINYKGADEIGPKEIEKMIAILQAQKAALED